MSKTIEYTITGIDEAHLVIFVDFKDHGHVPIQLSPESLAGKDALEEYLRNHLPSVEAVELKHSAPDLTFIKELVNVPQQTARRSLRPGEPNPATMGKSKDFSLSGAEPTSTNGLDQSEVQYITSLLEDILPGVLPSILAKLQNG